MKRLLLSALAGLALLPIAGFSAQNMQVLAGPSEIVTNNGVVSAPQIDAVNVVNYGTFVAAAPQPFETYDTLNFTNSGYMLGMVGWRFNNSSPTTSDRKLSANFVNFNPGYIEALDPPIPSEPPYPCEVAPVKPSYLLISATNIITGAGAPVGGASLIVGANGSMQLVGTNVDLSYSGLEVRPVWEEPQAEYTFGNPPTMFQPDIAIYDIYWAQDAFNQQNALNSAGLWNGVTASAQSAPAPPNGNSAPVASTPFSFNPSLADSYINVRPRGTMRFGLTNYTGDATNVLSTNITYVSLATNITKGAVFVAVPPGFIVANGFTASQNNLDQINVLLGAPMTNLVTASTSYAYISFQDTLGPGGRGILANVIGCPTNTGRPTPYDINRQGVLSGGPGNHGYPEPDFFISSSAILSDTNIIFDGFTNATLATVTAGDYAAYSAFIDNMVSRPKATPAGTYTNLPGRVRVFSRNLDLTDARIRGEGSIMLQTTHLVSVTNTVIDCENLSFNLTSSTGPLKVQNLAKPSVPRFRGTVDAWSATWSNVVTIEFTNNYSFTNVAIPTDDTGTNFSTNIVAIPVILTNYALISFNTLMLDARAVVTSVPVNVYDLNLHGKDVVVNDNMSVVQNLRIGGQSLTLNGSITVPGTYPADPITGLVPLGTPMINWSAANAPNLAFFTNNGSLSIPNLAGFGNDRPPYTAFINNGAISASGITLNSQYFENSGTLSAANSLFLGGGVGDLQNGSIYSGLNTEFTCDTVKFKNYQVNCGEGALLFYVTNALSDAGPGTGNLNTFQVQNGFDLMIKPQSGDLLGTTILDGAPSVPAVRINHQWAAEDRGATPAGYSDNAALGTLQLYSLSPHPLFVFAGTGAQNGLYVDLLDLSSLDTNFLSQIQVANNLVIYFAAARVPSGVDLGNMEPEEYLNGKLGGHLRWVESYAGPNSSLPLAVVVGSQTNSILVNKALFNSQIIDSDGDTIPNSVDATPFQAATLSVQVNGNGTVTPPGYSGKTLIVGQTYSLLAQPSDGSTFLGWSGSMSSSSPELTFVMTNGLSFTASFTFVPTDATYSGLFYEPSGVELQHSGAIALRTTKSGNFSGKIQTAADRYSFTGSLDDTGVGRVYIPHSDLLLQLQAGSSSIVGTIGNGAWTANVQADLAVSSSGSQPPFAGKYTMLFLGSGDPTNTKLPLGDGYAVVTVDNQGRLKLKGSLADGTKITQTTTVSADGQWPLFIPLAKGQGQILGWQTFASTGIRDVGGSLSWIQLPYAKAKAYPAGFTLQTVAVGSRYDSTQSPVTGFSSGRLMLSGSTLASPIVESVSVDSRNKVSLSGDRKQSLKLKSKQGLLNGKVLDPATGDKIKFNGVILQKQSVASGYFLDGGESGLVIMAQ